LHDTQCRTLREAKENEETQNYLIKYVRRPYCRDRNARWPRLMLHASGESG